MLARSSLLLVCFLLLAASGSASTVEEATSGAVSYQFDGGNHHDAPDVCTKASPDWSLPMGGATDGLLVAPDDVADAYTLEVPQSLVGKRLSLAVAEPTGSQDLRLDAFTPGCQGSIFDLVNWPTPEPSPPAPAEGEEQVALAATVPEHCHPHWWVLVLDQLDGLTAPPSVHLAWTDGSEGTVEVWQASSQHAVYYTTENLGITVKGAWANLPAGYAGALRLTHGPCDASDGGAVYGGSPTLEGGLLSFTPTRAGTHVVLVDLAGAPTVPSPATIDPTGLLPVAPHDVVEPVAEEVGLGHPHEHDSSASMAIALPRVSGTTPSVTTPTVTVPGIYAPMSCHYCLGGVEDVVKKVSYLLSASRAS